MAIKKAPKIHRTGAKAQVEKKKVIRMLQHPARIEIVRTMKVNQPEPVSPKELAEVMKLPLPNVSYHVKILREAGVIELKRTTPRRGAVEHHYALSPKLGEITDAAITLLA